MLGKIAQKNRFGLFAVLILSIISISYITIANPFDQVQNSLNSGITWLKEHQAPDGHWGYTFYSSDEFGNVINSTVQDVEYTSFSIISLASAGEENSESFKRAIGWLKNQQHEDGGWGLNKNLESHIAYTSLAIVALISGGENPNSQAIQNGINWIQNNRNIFIDDEVWGVYIETKYSYVKIEPNIKVLLIGDYGQKEVDVVKSKKNFRDIYQFTVPKGTKEIRIIIDGRQTDFGAILVNSENVLIDSAQGTGTLALNYMADGLWGIKKLTKSSSEETIYALLALKATRHSVGTELGIATEKWENATNINAYAGILNKRDSVERVKQSQKADNGWPSIKNKESDVISTSLAVQSLIANEPTSNKIPNAIEYIIKNQNKDGGWGMNENHTSTALPTSHAILALSSKKNNEVFFKKLVDSRL